MKSKLTLDQKYDFYERSVQNAEGEVEFMREEFTRIYGREAYTLREDFCGTGAISCAWVQQNKDCEAFGLDLDPEPIKMGLERHYSKLSKVEQKRMQYLKQDVLKAKAPKVDVVCAFNFSYFIFKERKQLLQYFKAVRKSMNKQGVFFLDLFGGPESQKLVTDNKKMKGLTYFWECQHFNPFTHECTFAIHFKDKVGKHENVFTYHWRFWTMPELRDLLQEAGFSKSVCYWEGDDGDGGGDGEYTPTADPENCDAWVSYIAALT
ncbi:MAG TPA: class I SAM-dependent methyltransferase [Bacteriovoracaceae bacterium]|nr:class I SAM-dependent methyltransferase [Bacteriovoracaceae bacterium]